MRHLVRPADADLLDTFLVSAIAAIVIIRIFLEATGYPQLGGGGLHIAHVLWGGLGMLVAIVCCSSISRRRRAWSPPSSVASVWVLSSTSSGSS
jgi:hypothetical protein